MNKKAQGLPLSFIVIAAIAALILVLIVAFVVGGGGGLLRQIFGAAPGELQSIQEGCQTSCNRLATITSDAQWDRSPYCTKSYAVDIGGDGKVGGFGPDGTLDKDEITKEIGLKCWNPGIEVGCTATFTTPTGEIRTCSMTAEGATDTPTDTCIPCE